MKRAWLNLILLPLIVIAGCATEPSPLDRTQPEAVHKAMFAGEWIYKMTVTDTDFDNPYTFIGDETATYFGTAMKIRWEITQDLLNAYKIPQRYRDIHGNLVENEIGQAGLVLSFRIKKHYDIRYRYNATTREDLNVIEENTDRPWNEREYMEVDWSTNLVPNLSNPTQMEIATGQVERVPVSVLENVEFIARGQTPDEDYRIDTRKWNPKKDPEVYVINIALKETITTHLSSWYQMFYGTYVPPVTVKSMHSLKRVPPPTENAYEPKQYGDDVFRRFGYFRTEYPIYDKERGPMENQKKYWINRWDLSGDKKIVWYASPQFQEQIDEGDVQLKEIALKAIGEWNKVLKEATGRTDEIMEFRENEVLKDEAGNPIRNLDGSKRWRYELGDIRYTMLNLITKPQTSAPLGYGPSTPDADTGEIVNATVNCYGNWVDFVIRRTMDQYDVASGNCTLDQVKDGYFFDPKTGKCDSSDFVGEYKGGILSSGLTEEAPKNTVRLHELTSALKTAWYPNADVAAALPAIPPQQRQIEIAALKQMSAWELKHPVSVDTNGFSMIAGTPYESLIIPRGNVHSLLASVPSPTAPDVIAALSPARRLGPAYLEAMKKREIQRAINYDDAIMFEPAIHAYVEEMKGKPRSEVYKTLRTWIWYTTILHEMGHTLGLRHNFRGSVDQANFSPDYWAAYNKYWDQIEALRAKYQKDIDAGDGQAYEAYVRAVDDIPAIHNRYGSTSIMDYMGDWVKWQYPVGSWDRAAILFGYGNKVEVMADGDDQWKLAEYKDGDFRVADPFDNKAKAESGRKVRYYLFCSDEKVFDDAFCTRFDVGVTATEITRNFIRDAQPMYFFKNFKRQSADFEARRESYYINKWLWTYYMGAKPLAQLQINSMRYDETWSSIWDGIDAIAAGPEKRDMVPGYKPNGGEDLLRASLLFYDYLLFDVLGRPEYGHYQLDYDTQGQRYWNAVDDRYLDDKKATATIEAGPGWGWDDRWDAQDDFDQYYAHLTRIGVELDKVIALEILSIPAALNEPLAMEKANGLSFWNSLWTANGRQAWEVIRGLITDNFSHAQNPWCIRCDANCLKDPANNRPQLVSYPVGLLDGLIAGGLVSGKKPQGQNRCGKDEYPVKPGMDALFAIKPIFYGIAGASHPWYENGVADHMDSQVVGGNHRFDIPEGVPTARFTNASGTKTYEAAQTEDGLGISYQLVVAGQKIKNKLDILEYCRNSQTPPPELVEAVGHDCKGVYSCLCDPSNIFCKLPDYCEPEGWSTLYLIDGFKWRELDRIEAMLIMMQDMIDIAGHYQWRVPGYLQEP